MGKTNLVPGRREVSVWGEEGVGEGIGKGKRVEASSGPEVEVPWRRRSVVVCVEEGGII